MITGTPGFDAIHILEIEGVDWREGSPSLVAHAAFINTKNGKTYGSTTLRTHWSQETLQKLEELRQLMEEDVARVVFDEGTMATSTYAARDAEPAGIGEYVGEARSI